MANTIKLYKGGTGGVQLVANNLFVIDNIADYLATFSSSYVTTITNFQYIKNELEIGINVDLSQDYSQPNKNPNYRYVSIQNDGEKIVYYYVKNMIWRSKTCVRFELVMDVLNTFKEDTDYKFKATTKITREHKDRYQIGQLTFTLNFSNYLEGGAGIQIDDEVYVAYQTTICKGLVTSVTTDYITFKVIDNTSLSEIKYKLDDMIAHSLTGDVTNIEYPVNLIQFDLASYTYTYDLMRNIDIVNENINPLLQCGNTEGSLIESHKTLLQQDWYLLYRNQNDPDESLVNPVECYLIPENATAVSTGVITNGNLYASSLEANKYYYLRLDSIADQITLSNGFSFPSIQGNNNVALIKKQSNGKLMVLMFGIVYSEQIRLLYTYNDIDYVTLNHLPQYYYASTTQESDIGDYYANILGNETDYWDSDSVEQYISSIENLDRTDAKNIKLIKLPYCPYNFNINSNKIDITSTNWNYTSLAQDNGTIYLLKLNNLNTQLRANIEISSNTKYPLDELPFNDPLSANITDLRKGIEFESKLFHSEFYRPTYYYDSFQFTMQLEKCNIPYYIINKTSKLNLQFDVTSTINSKFMFTFTNYALRNGEENYAIYMPIARNNEEVLYNVPYINYIRTGFNYDVKNKNISNASSWLSVAGSVATIGASLLVPSAPLKVAGVVGGVVSLAMSVKSAITTTINNENSIKQKILQEQNQASSVAGSDDVDLMSVYAENRLKYLVYQPNDVMKNLIFNLFFYAGYNSGRMGLPKHNTRVNFDYLECDAVFENVVGMPQECMNELINCFKNGVTYIHKTSRASNKWDIEQKYENWETMLFL